jgi:hypothetical protein
MRCNPARARKKSVAELVKQLSEERAVWLARC